MTHKLILAFTIVCAVYTYVNALECYSGFSMVRGQSVGTNTEVCKKDTDQCYKASAEATMVAKFKLAGCSTVRCMASPNQCSRQQYMGQQLEFCCCSNDLCNAKQNKTIASGLVDKLKGMMNFGGGSS